MRFNLIDCGVLGYVAWRIWRGGKRGFAVELPRLISSTLALVVGGGLFYVTERALYSAATLARLPGPIAFVVVLVGSFVLVRRFRRSIREWGATRIVEPDRQRRWGMLIGGIRGLAMGALIVLLSSLIPIGEFRKPFTRGSLFGRIVITIVRPAYRLAQQQR